MYFTFSTSSKPLTLCAFWTLALLGMITLRVESTSIDVPFTFYGSADTNNEVGAPKEMSLEYPRYHHLKRHLKDDYNNRNLADDVSPPYSNTIYVDPNIVTISAPSSLKTIEIYDDTQCVTFFDRRVDAGFVTGFAHIFDTTFTDGLKTQFWVSSTDFADREDAIDKVWVYANYLARVPQFIRLNIRVVMILDGAESWGGNSDGYLLIHSGSDFMAYTMNAFVHEGTHVSTDESVYEDPDWDAAVAADPGYISTYARNYTDFEDNAESVLLWLGIKLGTLNNAVSLTTTDQIPNRLAYYDNQNYNLFPLGDGTNSAPPGYVWEKLTESYYPCGEWEGGNKVMFYADTQSPTESPTTPTSAASGLPAKVVLPVVLYFVYQLLVL